MFSTGVRIYYVSDVTETCVVQKWWNNLDCVYICWLVAVLSSEAVDKYNHMKDNYIY